MSKRVAPSCGISPVEIEWLAFTTIVGGELVARSSCSGGKLTHERAAATAALALTMPKPYLRDRKESGGLAF